MPRRVYTRLPRSILGHSNIIMCGGFLCHLTGSGSVESGIRDAFWELGVSRATVWR